MWGKRLSLSFRNAAVNIQNHSMSWVYCLEVIDGSGAGLRFEAPGKL